MAKIHGRENYKAGPRDDCGSPPYSVVSIVAQIEQYRIKLNISRDEFVIWEPAVGMMKRKLTGLVEGFEHLGYPVFYRSDLDFLNANFFKVQGWLGYPIRMIVTNPPYSVAMKRRFINKCMKINRIAGIPWALLMTTTTLVEKINGHTMRGCAVHVPKGRICYNMPNKGWGTREDPTKATFETNWFSYGLADTYSIHYSDFDVSDHFKALDRFYSDYY